MSRQKQWVLLDKFRRQFFLKFEFRRRVLKSLVKNTNINLQQRILVKLVFVKLEKRSSLTKHRNRCLISGRVYNVLKKTQYSRFVFRKNANFGALPGVSRLSR